MLIMDMSSTVHNCLLFQYDNPKYKNELIKKIYIKIHRTIYDSKGNQKDNFKNGYHEDGDLYGDYQSNNEPSSGVF
jgi:hypothetical protein